MVEVYLFVGFPGHISLKVDGGSPSGTMYLSRFPATNLAKFAGPGIDQNYAQDVADYGAPHVVRLSKLNETAVKSAVVTAQRTMVYSAFLANCASHVKFCLDSGVTGSRIGGTIGWLGMGAAVSETPYGVYAYAQSLRAISG